MYGLFCRYQDLEFHTELCCASDDKDKLKNKAYQIESKYIYDETFNDKDILVLGHCDYIITKIEIL